MLRIVTVWWQNVFSCFTIISAIVFPRKSSQVFSQRRCLARFKLYRKMILAVMCRMKRRETGWGQRSSSPVWSPKPELTKIERMVEAVGREQGRADGVGWGRFWRWELSNEKGF